MLKIESTPAWNSCRENSRTKGPVNRAHNKDFRHCPNLSSNFQSDTCDKFYHVLWIRTIFYRIRLLKQYGSGPKLISAKFLQKIFFDGKYALKSIFMDQKVKQQRSLKYLWLLGTAEKFIGPGSGSCPRRPDPDLIKKVRI
jgi:hypothetical protein